MPPRRRPAVKSKLEQAPEIKPQASVSSGAFYAPSRPQLSTQMDQLGQALRQLGSGVGDMLVNKAGEQSKEDLATGARIALAHMDDLRKNSSNVLKRAEQEGWLPNGARPDVKEGFLRQSGAIWAQSPQVTALLDDGMETFINSWGNKAGSMVDFHNALDARNRQIVDEAREALDNNFYSRDEGFMNSIPEVLAKHRKKWTDRYTNIVSINQMNVASKGVKEYFRIGTPEALEAAKNYFFTGQSHPGTLGEVKSLKTGGDFDPNRQRVVVAPKDLWPAGQSPRVGFYTMVEEHALYDLAKNPNDIEGITRAMGFVSTMSSLRNPANKARMDSGLLQSHYGKLRSNLSTMLGNALSKRQANEADLLESAVTKMTTLVQLRPGGEYDDMEYRVVGADGTIQKKIFTPGDMTQFLTDWENNAIVHPRYDENFPDSGIPKTVRYALSEGSYESPEEADKVRKGGWALTDEELPLLTDQKKFEGILTVIDRINARVQGQKGDIAEQGKLAQDDFNRRVEREADDLVNFFRPKPPKPGDDGPAPVPQIVWSDEDMQRISEKVGDKLREYATANKLNFSLLKWKTARRAFADTNHGETYHSSADQERYTHALTTLASANGHKHWLNKSDVEVEMNIRELFGAKGGLPKKGDELSEGQIDKLTKLFVGKTKAWGRFMDITGTAGKGTSFENLMFKKVMIEDPALAQLFQKNRKQIGPFFHGSPMETYFKAHLHAYMRRVYIPWMDSIGTNFDYDGEAFDKKEMDSFMFSMQYGVAPGGGRGAPTPLSYQFAPAKPPMTRSMSLLQEFLLDGYGPLVTPPGGGAPVRKYPNGWRDRIAAEMGNP